MAEAVQVRGGQVGVLNTIKRLISVSFEESIPISWSSPHTEMAEFVGLGPVLRYASRRVKMTPAEML